jgi:hypothetical protein
MGQWDLAWRLISLGVEKYPDDLEDLIALKLWIEDVMAAVHGFSSSQPPMDEETDEVEDDEIDEE